MGGNMVTLVRDSSDPYQARTGLAPLDRVALSERPFPAEWRSAAGNDVAPDFLSYAAPLLGGIAKHKKLERHQVVKKMAALAESSSR